MADVKSKPFAHEAEPSGTMSADEKESVIEQGGLSPKVIHEVVRLQGDEELDRPFVSLLFSGFAAGIAISASVLAETFLSMRLPEAAWKELIVSFGYAVGFVIVILGKLQLFTESTVTAVLPLVTHVTSRNVARLLRLWTIVFIANLAGTFLVATLMAGQIIIGPEQLATTIELSKHVLAHDVTTTLFRAMPAGFLIASIAWILPNARGSEFWVVVLITYVIALGEFSHVVAGSAEAWLLMLTGHTTLSGAVGGFVLPALLGNIIGGTGLFAFFFNDTATTEIYTDA
jgi:formate/nitrite transporter FocA (FNT family)